MWRDLPTARIILGQLKPDHGHGVLIKSSARSAKTGE
jgi:hypothetical protein